MMPPLHHIYFSGTRLPANRLLGTFVCTLLLVCVSCSLFAQAPAWLWAKRTGGTNIDYTNDVAADGFGNCFITGQYYSAPIIFGTDTLLNSGLTDVFLVKYNAAGNVVWTRKIGNTGSEFGQSVATDAAGNVYVAGAFSSPTIVIGSITLTTAGSSDIFVAKYDNSGNVLW